jgi:hypothetical protein
MSDKAEVIECAGVGGFLAKSRGASGEFILVAIAANRQNRYVEATAFLNNIEIGKISAADMALAGAISSQFQMLTLPIPMGAQWRIQWNVANHNGEVKLWRITG